LASPAAMALVLGENIGTTITAQLATIGATSVNAYRAARAHALFNVIGVIIILAIFPFFLRMVTFATHLMGAGEASQVVAGDMVYISRYIANGHTLFNVVNAFIFLFLLPWLIKAAILLSPKEDIEDQDLFRMPNFDDRFIDNPIAAITQVRSEISRMADVALITLKNTLESLQTRNAKKLSKWQRYEDHLDAMQKDIIRYLTRIYQEDVSEVEAKELSSMIRVTNNIERIGDAVENLAEMSEDIIDKDIHFSKDALKDIQVISNQAVAFLMLVQGGMQKTTSNFMSDAQTIEDNIDFMRDEMRNDHIFRLKEGICSNEPGLIFSDILSNFEKIGDYCYNIAQGIAGIK